jgi:hypothetical protein
MHGTPNLWETLTASVSQSAATKLAKKYHQDISPISQNKFTMSVLTFARVIIPSIIAGVVAYLLFPAIAMFLCTTLNDAGVFAVLSQDSSQFVQNFLTVAGLLFSILVGQVRDGSGFGRVATSIFGFPQLLELGWIAHLSS